ncbi:S1/P1 nuclease [Catenaria anguillulae PL171]|uniref:S1/P1 nuclease n=1 Tax=Catenaria anguillulae PL171 TaxID=765915 RepID=A0A1Y2H6N9_9FUNG|nr:S1/P1 nuclease [Catenaria anguillulae PL171]
MTPILAVLTLLLVASTANAWGRTAHQAVATLAYSNLTPAAKSAVDSIISASSDISSIQHASTWPDEIKGQRPETGSQHYINYSADEQPMRGKCANTAQLPSTCDNSACVVTAIALYSQALANSNKQQPTAESAEYLAFLVHFVGDLAQPLHASGFEKGGNGVNVKFRGKRANLHAAWDGSIPEQTIKQQYGGDAQRWIGYLSNLVKPGDAKAECAASGDPKSVDGVTKCAASWAEDSTALVCSTVYPTGFQIGQEISTDYYQAVYKTVDVQVAKAGLRLAALLNKILGGK